jgi:hypothetical protein
MSDQIPSGQLPSGWYPDPNPGADDPAGQQRYWNGSAWTQRTAVPSTPLNRLQDRHSSSPARSTTTEVVITTDGRPPADWYSDPSGAPGQRWWNGTTWTEATWAYPPPDSDNPPAPGRQPQSATAAKKSSFGTRYRETWVKTSLIAGAITTVMTLVVMAAEYDFSSDAEIVAFLIDGAVAFGINFLLWGSLVNLVVAAIRSGRARSSTH